MRGLGDRKREIVWSAIQREREKWRILYVKCPTEYRNIESERERESEKYTEMESDRIGRIDSLSLCRPLRYPLCGSSLVTSIFMCTCMAYYISMRGFDFESVIWNELPRADESIFSAGVNFYAGLFIQRRRH